METILTCNNGNINNVSVLKKLDTIIQNCGSEKGEIGIMKAESTAEQI